MLRRTFTAIFALVVIAIFVCYTDIVEAQIVTDGLISYWTFDDSDMEDGVVKDVWGINNGTIMGDPQVVEGKIEEALEFDGLDDYVDCGNDESLNITENITIEAWVKPGQLINAWYYTIVSKRDDSDPSRQFHFDLRSQGKLNFGWRLAADGWHEGSTADVLVEAGDWYHVAVTFDSKSTPKLYANGTARPSAFNGDITDMPASERPLTIAAYGSISAPNVYSGAIDEVRVYNRVLSEDEIRKNYEAKNQFAIARPDNDLTITWGGIKAKN